MSTTADLAGIARRSVKDKPRVGIGRNGLGTASDTWIVPIENVQAFITVVSGTQEEVGGETVRTIPLQFKENDNAYAVEVDGDYQGLPVGRPEWMGELAYGGAYDYGWVEFRVTYETPSFSFDFEPGEAYLSYSSRPSGRTVGADPSAGKFADNTRTSHSPGILLPGWTFEVTQHNLAQTNEAKYVNYIGKVNSSTFRGVPRGQMMYSGPAYSSSYTAGGLPKISVTHSFEVSSEDWNYEVKLDGTKALWQLEGTTPRHDYVSFPLLFS